LVLGALSDRTPPAGLAGQDVDGFRAPADRQREACGFDPGVLVATGATRRQRLRQAVGGGERLAHGRFAQGSDLDAEAVQPKVRRSCYSGQDGGHRRRIALARRR